MVNEEKIQKTSIFEKLGLVEKIKDVEKPFREKEQIIKIYNHAFKFDYTSIKNELKDRIIFIKKI